MREFMICLMCLGILCGAEAAEKKKAAPKQVESLSSYQAAFDYRDIQLGITLSEFKEKAPAAKASQLTMDYRYADFSIEPVCSDEDRGKKLPLGLRALDGTESSGGAACAWGYYRASKYHAEWARAKLVVGGHTSNLYRFDFIQKPGDQEPRLYRIQIAVSASAFPAIANGLEEKFGPPSGSRVGNVQNGLGATFESVTKVWANKVSKIELIQRHLEINESWLSYELIDYAKYADSLFEKRRKESTNL